MSCLAIYHPGDFVHDEVPVTIPFPGIHKIREHSVQNDVVERAKLVHANRCCQQCGSVAVSSIELNDALLNASLQPIPGSATIVAFRCSGCYHEWPAKR